ncbi:MAG: hypothetical protein ABI597_02990 [Gammaproteobacteria bacterium]
MELTIIGLIISLISPIVAIYLYKENKKFVLAMSDKNSEYIKQLHSEKVSAEKMENVIASFLQMYNASKDTGISALIKSGISSLDKEHEMKYIIAEVQIRTGKHPLGSYASQIEQAGLLNFFKKIDLPTFKTSSGMEKVLEEIDSETKSTQQ